jgi:hypothetical protein
VIVSKIKISEAVLRGKIRNILIEKKWEDLNAPKGQTINLYPEDFEDYEPGELNLGDEIFTLINTAYADVEIEPGVFGNIKVRKAEDLPAGYTIMLAADLDSDPEPDYFRGMKNRGGKKKLGIVGHDGSEAAVQKYLTETAEMLKAGGIAEMSGKIAHIMITRHGVPAYQTKQDVESALGKKVQWIGRHPVPEYADRYGPDYEGWYERGIGGAAHMKILLGG